MIDYVVIPAPHSFPYACVWCMGQKGPMVDSHREVPGAGHVFLCERCAKSISRVFGFASGKKLDELAAAADSVNERDREIASVVEERDTARAERDEERRKNARTEEMLAESHARVLQLEAKMAENARLALELVGTN